MPYIRAVGSSLTTGTPFIAIIADQDNPTTRTVLGGPDNTAMVEHRWEMYLEDGMPADHDTLIATLDGSHTICPGWEPAGDDYAAAINIAQQILDTGQSTA